MLEVKIVPKREERQFFAALLLLGHLPHALGEACLPAARVPTLLLHHVLPGRHALAGVHLHRGTLLHHVLPGRVGHLVLPLPLLEAALPF